MKKIFVYYSLSGNGDYVAEIMENLGYEILKLHTIEKWPKSFALRIMKGGFLASINAKSKLTIDENNLKRLNTYDRVVVGTPIWNGRLSSPINSVISVLDRPFELLCYSGSGKAQKVEEQLKHKKLEKMTILTEPLKNKIKCKSIIEKEIK